MANRYMQVMISRIKDFERNACNTIDPGSDSKQLTSALETFRGTVINVALFSEAAKELRDRVHGLPKRVKNVFDFIDQDRQTTKETNKTYIKNNEIRHKLKTEVKIHTVVFLGITLAVNRIKSLKINDFQEICRLAEQYIQVHNLKSDLEQKEFLLVIPGWIKSIPKWAGDYEVFKETVVRKCLSKNLANDNAGCEADEPAPKKRKVLPLVVKQIDGDQALTSIRRRPDLVDSRAILDACEPGSDQPLCLSFFPRAETASLFESLSIGIDQTAGAKSSSSNARSWRVKSEESCEYVLKDLPSVDPIATLMVSATREEFYLNYFVTKEISQALEQLPGSVRCD